MTDLVKCEGGPLNGRTFTPAEWVEHRKTTDPLQLVNQPPTPIAALYTQTSRTTTDGDTTYRIASWDVTEPIRWPTEKGISLAGGGHPPGGRCLAVCYCRKCPHYKPLPKPVQHRAPAPKKRNASTERMAESWKTREEPTWIDKQ